MSKLSNAMMIPQVDKDMNAPWDANLGFGAMYTQLWLSGSYCSTDWVISSWGPERACLPGMAPGWPCVQSPFEGPSHLIRLDIKLKICQYLGLTSWDVWKRFQSILRRVLGASDHAFFTPVWRGYNSASRRTMYTSPRGPTSHLAYNMATPSRDRLAFDFCNLTVIVQFMSSSNSYACPCHSIIYSVNNLARGKEILWAWPACTESSGIWGGGAPPPPKVKFHVKNGAFYAFLELYLNKFTVPHVVIFRNYGVKLYKKAICPKICEILSITREPWDYGPCPTKSVRITEIPWGLATLYLW